MLASLLDPPGPIPDQATLLDALAQCDGNVDQAAKILIDKRATISTSNLGLKRKRAAGLDEWLGGSLTKARYNNSASRNTSKPSSSGSAGTGGKAAAIDTKAIPNKPLLDVRRDASPERRPVSSTLSEITEDSTTASPRPKPISSSKKRYVTNDQLLSLLRPPNSKEGGKKPAQLPPLTLGTPSLVEEHTPCTHYPSILPPDMACR